MRPRENQPRTETAGEWWSMASLWVQICKGNVVHREWNLSDKRRWWRWASNFQILETINGRIMMLWYPGCKFVLISRWGVESFI